MGILTQRARRRKKSQQQPPLRTGATLPRWGAACCATTKAESKAKVKAKPRSMLRPYKGWGHGEFAMGLAPEKRRQAAALQITGWSGRSGCRALLLGCLRGIGGSLRVRRKGSRGLVG